MKVNSSTLVKSGLFILLFSQFTLGQNDKEIKNLDALINYAKEQNLTIKNNQLQSELAAITKKTALGNILNPRIPSTAQVINNFDQQVSFLPGPIFGQPEGTYKTVTMGQQYVSTFSVQPQVDLINLGNIALLKSANLNVELVNQQNKLNEQNVYNQINTLYFNLLYLQKQIEIFEENKKIAEQILAINQNKFKEGIVRKQDVNEAESNLIVIEDKLQQALITLKIQHESLRVFLNTQENLQLKEELKFAAQDLKLAESTSNLKTSISQLQYQNVKQEVKVAQWSQLPVLSLISSFNWQNQSNTTYFDKNSNWVNYNYIGLKLSWDVPTTIQKLSTVYSKKIQLEQAKNNAEQAAKENESMNNQLVLEYEKAVQQVIHFEKIYQLKKDTFEKNKNQFDEEILPLDKLLLSQNEFITSEINLASALANCGFSKYKILINNN